jgi:hypothetical protein
MKRLGISFFILLSERVQYKWHSQGFYHLQKSSQLEVEFPCGPEGHHGHTAQLVDLWDRTRVYPVCFLFSTCT